MLSRIGRVIANHRYGIGMFYNTMRHIFTPVLPLIIKSAFGLLGMGLGVMLVNMKGGEDDEDSL